ncbi:MAG TPA: T9SS type A sorting domain-containing protein [bacterium]|nr:T9SS type A sorting domain-containing protein [bacterium]HPN46251.1 T9SS type A sorting domain-containing protein [bacterium]
MLTIKLIRNLIYSPWLTLILLLILGEASLFANNGLVIGWHEGTGSYWSHSELGIPPNYDKPLSVTTTHGTIYGTLGAGEPTAGAKWAYGPEWDNGSGTKGWVFPMTTSGFENLTLTFYQKSRDQSSQYGPRDFKLQYSTNGSSWTDVAGTSFVLTNSWQQFNATLPSACDEQATLYLKWVMSSNVSINGGAIVAEAMSEFADFYMNGDELPLPITDVSLSNTSISSNKPSGTTVGDLSHTDANYYDTHTYSLVAGEGDTDNSSFAIAGTTLKTAAVLSAGDYSIRVQVDDGTYTLAEIYTITVTAYPSVIVENSEDNAYWWITRVQFGDIDKSSGMSGTNNADGYSDYTSESAGVTRGQSIDLTVTVNIPDDYGEYLNAYFDWNRDYDLEDAGEKVEIATISGESGTISKTVNVTVPADAALGSTLMRVAIDYYGNMALGVADIGEVEDYTIDIVYVTFTNGSAFTSAVTPGNGNQALGRFQLTGSATGATLTAASIKLNGTRTGLSNLKLWSSTNNTFESGSDTQLGSTVAVDPGDGSSASFSGFSSAIGTSGTYYFLTGDIAAGATGAVQGVIVANGNLTVSGGTLSGTITNAPLSNGDASLPVELASFTAVVQGNAIILNWQTATETDNLGFILERAAGNGAWQPIASYKTNPALKGQGNASTTNTYSFTDNTVVAGSEYRYRLGDVNVAGTVTMHSPIYVTTTALPQSTVMLNAYPNPFNPETTIKYTLHKDAQVTITVYDLLGRKVKTLIDEQQSAGSYRAIWNGTDASGNKAASGAYLVQMQTGEISQTQKVLLLK